MSPPRAAPVLRTDDFAYELPEELIAQTPAEPRDSSRLLVVGSDGPFIHAVFRELPSWLRPGDVVVANRSRVLAARLEGRLGGGGRVELLLLRRITGGTWEALGRPGRRLRPGTRVALSGGIEASVEERLEEGLCVVCFEGGEEAERRALEHGRVPLPPYIRRWTGDPERYQTVYADTPGSAAAPTAGLHFTPRLMERLREAGVELRYVTLHVGLDTFRPVRVEQPDAHRMHAEYFEVPRETAQAVRRAREEGRRIVAVGTTVVRTLESVAEAMLSAGDGEASQLAGWTRLFILPGYRFQVIDGLITNFHLPRSTLLMLVSAFVGRERVLAAYAEAIRCRYRFYSFGDAMLAWRAG